MPSIEITPKVIELPKAIRYEYELAYPDKRDNVVVYYEVFGSTEKPDSFDGILFALIFHAMKEGLDIKLAGPASTTALINLKEFQLAWSCWLPRTYRPIDIEVSHLIERTTVNSDQAISAFSGGVDATFTLYNHAPTKSGLHHNLTACMLVHGFDIALHNQNDFDSVLEMAKQMHSKFGLKTFWVKTNIKALGLQDWEHSFAAQLVSCLQHFSKHFSIGLVGSSEPYHALVVPWGSSPITDHLLSGSAMKTVHDGAGFSRTDKIEVLSHIPGAIDNLRVCWQGKKQDRNCGKCEKCVRTKLNLLACGVQNPPCFDEPLQLADIDEIKVTNEATLAELRSILDYAKQNKIKEAWVEQLRRRVDRGVNRSWKNETKAFLARIGLLNSALSLKRRLRNLKQKNQS